jgi:hypothetical protein
MKLKYREISEYRTRFLQDQDYTCALCGDLIIDDAVLDHSHKTGHIRSVLHRGCNALLGKIENNLARNRLDTQRLTTFALRLVDYIKDSETEFLHPTYKTQEDKKNELIRKRARKKATKAITSANKEKKK